MIGFIVMRMGEKRGGWSLKKRQAKQVNASDSETASSGEEEGLKYPEKTATGEATVAVKSVGS